jgi:hypothetical protein
MIINTYKDNEFILVIIRNCLCLKDQLPINYLGGKIMLLFFNHSVPFRRSLPTNLSIYFFNNFDWHKSSNFAGYLQAGQVL